jgi:hypothetical protein
VDRRAVTRALRLGGDIFWYDAVTVHQRTERPNLVGARQSHLPLEQLIDCLSFREVEFLDLLFVVRDCLSDLIQQGSAATRSLTLAISALRVEFSASEHCPPLR